jgi:putative tryptophan/tyrosine transport system substrate-binding protein
MRRRDFIKALGGGAAAAWPLAARAQERMARIGILGPNSAATTGNVAPLLDGLKQAGYIEGRNLAVEYSFAEGRIDQLPALAADLARRQVQVIVTVGTPAALAAKSATSTVPIVFELGLDPVQAGIVVSFNRPGGNITGVTNFSAALAAKRIELLHLLVPHVDTIGILTDPAADRSTQTADVQDAVRALGLKAVVLNASNDQEIDAAFGTMVRQKIAALLLTDQVFYNSRREQLIALARFNGISAMYTFPEFAQAGGLISYGSSQTDAMHRTAAYVARILKGEKPGDLPIQQPTKFELVINLKTAKALGLTVPPNLLALADEVIE